MKFEEMSHVPNYTVRSNVDEPRVFESLDSAKEYMQKLLILHSESERSFAARVTLSLRVYRVTEYELEAKTYPPIGD